MGNPRYARATIKRSAAPLAGDRRLTAFVDQVRRNPAALLCLTTGFCPQFATLLSPHLAIGVFEGRPAANRLRHDMYRRADRMGWLWLVTGGRVPRK